MPPAQYYGHPMVPFHQQRPVYPPSFMGGGFHFKNCPRAGNMTLPQQTGEGERDQFRLTGTNQVGNHKKKIEHSKFANL